MKMMKVGLIGFGRTGKAVASVILDNPDICLEWVMRKSHILEHRSVPEFFGVESREPGFIHSIDEFTAEGLLDHLPVDVIIDFSSATGIHYYGKAAADQPGDDRSTAGTRSLCPGWSASPAPYTRHHRGTEAHHGAHIQRLEGCSAGLV